MILTAYCEKEPIASALAKARAGMPVQDQVDIEDALQRWALWGPEAEHIYAYAGAARYQVLAHRVPYVRRYLVAVHDLNVPEIVVVSIDRGEIRKVLRPAFLYLGINAGVVVVNTGWTG
jgi:hypothetical protein